MRHVFILLIACTLVGCERAPEGSTTVVAPSQPPPASTRDPHAADDDARIVAAVEAELRAEPGLRELPLRVAARNGIVVLEGQVDDVQTAQHAGVIAAAVEGVIEVDNRLALGRAR